MCAYIITLSRRSRNAVTQINSAGVRDLDSGITHIFVQIYSLQVRTKRQLWLNFDLKLIIIYFPNYSFYFNPQKPITIKSKMGTDKVSMNNRCRRTNPICQGRQDRRQGHTSL